MAALDFPNAPNIGDTWPNPPQTGVPTYRWSGTDWLSAFPLGVERLPIDGSLAMTGPLTLSGPPTQPLHATSKDYVDTSAATGLAAKAVRYDAAQTLTSAQKAQARSNIDMLKKNYIINGAMQVSQENGTTAATANGYYPVDQFMAQFSDAGFRNFHQSANPTPGGSPYRIRTTVSTADASVAALDFYRITHTIEGLRITDLKSGSATAKTVTLQFGVKAPAGTYCVSFNNAGDTRSYVAEYIIAAGEANTDVVKSVTLTLDTTGTWATDNTLGIRVSWALMVGSTFQTAAGAWAAGNFMGSPNQFNFMGTAGNVFELFDVSLTEGTVAPPFQVPDYASELALCQRYFETIYFGSLNQILHSGVLTGAISYSKWSFKVRKRATPTSAGGPGVAWVNITPTANIGVDEMIFSHGSAWFHLAGTANAVALTASARL